MTAFGVEKQSRASYIYYVIFFALPFSKMRANKFTFAQVLNIINTAPSSSVLMHRMKQLSNICATVSWPVSAIIKSGTLRLASLCNHRANRLLAFSTKMPNIWKYYIEYSACTTHFFFLKSILCVALRSPSIISWQNEPPWSSSTWMGRLRDFGIPSRHQIKTFSAHKRPKGKGNLRFICWE